MVDQMMADNNGVRPVDERKIKDVGDNQYKQLVELPVRVLSLCGVWGITGRGGSLLS